MLLFNQVLEQLLDVIVDGGKAAVDHEALVGRVRLCAKGRRRRCPASCKEDCGQQEAVAGEGGAEPQTESEEDGAEEWCWGGCSKGVGRAGVGEWVSGRGVLKRLTGCVCVALCCVRGGEGQDVRGYAAAMGLQWWVEDDMLVVGHCRPEGAAGEEEAKQTERDQGREGEGEDATGDAPVEVGEGGAALTVQEDKDCEATDTGARQGSKRRRAAKRKYHSRSSIIQTHRRLMLASYGFSSVHMRRGSTLLDSGGAGQCLSPCVPECLYV
jgi:hypothetical protein